MCSDIKVQSFFAFIGAVFFNILYSNYVLPSKYTNNSNVFFGDGGTDSSSGGDCGGGDGGGE